MKKLNRKGFTLIELLAVIVIMAIILIVTVPNIIQSIGDARVNSIHNLAVSAANTYNTAYGQDLVATANNKVLGNIPEEVNGTWKCIGDIYSTDSTGAKLRELSDILGISDNDVILTNNDNPQKVAEPAFIKNGMTANHCSSIRIYNGGAEVILVAKNGGRFYVAQKTTYAYSKDTAAVSE